MSNTSSASSAYQTHNPLRDGHGGLPVLYPIDNHQDLVDVISDHRMVLRVLLCIEIWRVSIFSYQEMFNYPKPPSIKETNPSLAMFYN